MQETVKKEYISREAALSDEMCEGISCQECPFLIHPVNGGCKVVKYINGIPAADVVEEENVLKFYYVRSIDEYWIGRRIDNFYYAEYDASCGQWVWSHSRYLPWGQHVVAPGTLWKEHTYPSEPEEIPFGEWLTGFIKKNNAADVVEVKHGRWVVRVDTPVGTVCSECGFSWSRSINAVTLNPALSKIQTRYCPNCGAKMDGGVNDAAD